MALKKSYPLLAKTDPWICTASKLTLSIRSIGAIYRKHLNKHKVTMSQLSILMVVGKSLEIPQSEIGKILRLERSTVSRDLQRLIEKGYMRKKQEGGNILILITDKGAAYTERIIPDWLKATREANAKLGQDGEQALNLVLQKLTS